MINTNPALVWIILAVLLTIFEFFIPGVWLIWFVVPALITALSTWLFALSFSGQLAVFAVLSLMITLLLWKTKKPSPKNDPVVLNQRGSEFIGQSYTLTDPVVNGRGRLALGDGMWTIQGEDCPSGTKIQIVSVEGNHLCFIIIQ